MLAPSIRYRLSCRLPPAAGPMGLRLSGTPGISWNRPRYVRSSGRLLSVSSLKLKPISADRMSTIGRCAHGHFLLKRQAENEVDLGIPPHFDDGRTRRPADAGDVNLDDVIARGQVLKLVEPVGSALDRPAGRKRFAGDLDRRVGDGLSALIENSARNGSGVRRHGGHLDTQAQSLSR